MSNKPREFYVNVTEHSWGYSKDYWSRWQRKSHDIVHVIEHSAYQALEQKLAVALEALEHIADESIDDSKGFKIEWATYRNSTVAQKALAQIKGTE